MKILPLLILFALLLTVAAWVSLQGVSEARPLSSVEIPLAAPPLPALRSAAPRRQASVPAKEAEQKPAKPSALQIALQAGDLCETARVMSNNVPAAELYAAILAAIDPSPELAEAYSPRGPLLSTTPPADLSKASVTTQLLWALRHGDRLSFPGSTFAGASTKSARDLLAALEKSDSGNGFYPYLRLSIEDQLGTPREQLVTIAESIASASEFHNPARKLDLELREAAWLNPALHYAINSNHYFSVNFWMSHDNLIRLARDQDFRGNKRIAQMMTEEGSRATRSSAHNGYESTRYTYGQGLDPENHKPSHVLEKELGGGEYRGSPAIFQGERACDPGPYEAYFYELRNSR